MIFYYGKTYTYAQAACAVVGIRCEKCRCQYYYELARVGTGSATASYGLGTSSAMQTADEKSADDLQKRLAEESELVPCPNCNWISEELVAAYRRTRYQAVGGCAFFSALILTVISLISAWFISIGNQLDRWLLPYLLVGVPVVMCLLTLGMFQVQRWLQNRIQPNRDYPQPPTLPLGTPPALLLDESTQQLRLAKPNPKPASTSNVSDVPLAKPDSTPASTNNVLEFQLGRHTLPEVCCVCLQAAADGVGETVQLSTPIPLRVPMCLECSQESNRTYWRSYRKSFFTGFLVGAGVIGFIAWREQDWCTAVVWSLVLLMIVLIVAATVASSRSRQVKIVGSDPERGVYLLEFRNPEYVQHLCG
jgi:uncharacterized protein (DUF983 family)